MGSRRAGDVELYTSHLLSAWGDRLWQFALPILLVDIFGDTLLPAALYSALVYLLAVVGVPVAGGWVDSCERLSVVRAAIIGDNACVVLSCALLAVLAMAEDLRDEGRWALLVAAAIVSAAGEILNQAQTLAVERDWLPQTCVGQSSRLTHVNAVMQRIDLCCKTLAPSLIGALLQFAPTDTKGRVTLGAAGIAAWNLLSMPAEVMLLKRFYAVNEARLAAREHRHEDGTVHSHKHGVASHAHASHGLGECEEAREHDHAGVRHVHALGGLPHTHVVDETTGTDILLLKQESRKAARRMPPARSQSPCSVYVGRFALFAKHRVALASIAFSLLFMTVLDNGTLVTSYFEWRSFPPTLLGASRGAGAAVGLVATFIFPRLTARWGGSFELVGLAALWLFALCLLPSPAAFLLLGECRTTDWITVVSMVTSRAGLWMFDLAETQIMQEYVEEGSRGALNAVQTSLYQLFYVGIQLVGMLYHDPRLFAVLVVWSGCAVSTAAVLYTIWYRLHARSAMPAGGAGEPMLRSSTGTGVETSTT